MYFYTNMKLCTKDAGTCNRCACNRCALALVLQENNVVVLRTNPLQLCRTPVRFAFSGTCFSDPGSMDFISRFFFSTRTEGRSKFKSPGVCIAPWLHWIWSDSTAGLNPKATIWVKFLQAQLELQIKNRLMNEAHCGFLQLALHALLS